MEYLNVYKVQSSLPLKYCLDRVLAMVCNNLPFKLLIQILWSVRTSLICYLLVVLHGPGWSPWSWGLLIQDSLTSSHPLAYVLPSLPHIGASWKVLGQLLCVPRQSTVVVISSGMYSCHNYMKWNVINTYEMIKWSENFWQSMKVYLKPCNVTRYEYLDMATFFLEGFTPLSSHQFWFSLPTLISSTLGNT